MIFRNFSKHLKEQNWFGVGLDFLVVVLGIFVGFQASEWNQSRLDRQEADYQLGFLHDELIIAIQAAEQEIVASEDILLSSFTASQLLTEASWDPEQRQKFDQSLFATFELWGPKHRPVSLRRMIDDGKLDLIGSKTLQQAILAFESAYLDAIDQTTTAYAYSLQLTPQITSAVRFKGPAIVSTSEELLDNMALRSAVRDKAIWQRIQLEVLDTLQAARKALLAELTAHRGTAAAID